MMLFVVLSKGNIESMKTSTTGMFMIAYPLFYMIPFNKKDPQLFLFTMCVTWAADIFGLLIGKSLGKNKLSTLSPKKTWEGAIAGLIGSFLVAYGFSFYINSLEHLLMMAFLGNIMGQLGDLFESSLKRAANVKDSGTLVPGHGGVLDRLDAHIFCTPTIYYYALYFSFF